MLKRFVLKNYKNFKDEIRIDFENIAGYQFSMDCIKDEMISKMLIYGKNATGKTNLGRALMNICYTLDNRLEPKSKGVFLNADSAEKMAEFCYTFQFDNQELEYRYHRFSDQELCDEQLLIDGITIFECDFSTRSYKFENLHYIHAETANIDMYLASFDVGIDAEGIAEPTLPFLRWLISNVAFPNTSVLLRLSYFVRRMTVITTGASKNMMLLSKSHFNILLDQYEKCQDLEDFLNAMGIKCKLVLKKLPDGQIELYFAHDKLVPFYENASSGTLALLDLYRRLVLRVRNASLIYLDEFDAFYHYEMAENVMKYFKKKFPECQVIMTSHNTNLMTNRLMRPDCVFILSGTGKLTALCNATQRELREGHNLEKMYISGEFEKYE